MTQATLPSSPVTIALDVGDTKTQVCELRGKEVVLNKSIPTTKSALDAEFATRPPTHVVLEVGSQSPWMSALLRSLGHEVLIVDARRVAKMATGFKKTDRRDAETLARLAAGVPELLGDVKHRPPEMYADLALLRARDQLVRTRTRLILTIRGMLKTTGTNLPAFSARCFGRKAVGLIPVLLRPAIEPLLDTLQVLELQIARYEKMLEEAATKRYPATAKLRQVNGVGPVTSMAFVLTMFNPHRFKKSSHVGSWVGLAPKKRESGDSDPQLKVTREGNPFLRRLLISAAHYIIGPFGKDCNLRRFGLRICERGAKNAKKRAIVAVARKLAVLLHRLWLTDKPYEPLRGVATA